MEYKQPDKDTLQRVYKLAFKEEFLRINNLKVGDEIEWSFPYEAIKSRYNKRGQDRYTFSRIIRGILKEDESGFLYAESLETVPFYHLETKGKSEFYKQEMKHSVVRLGTGFIH